MNIYIIDGQGGGIGRSLIEGIKQEAIHAEVVALGSNAMATASMLKAGANAGATGENAILYCCGRARERDVIIGPMGIILANSMLGEFSAAMAAAVSQSSAHKILLPVSRCHATIAGVAEKTLAQYIDDAIIILKGIL